MSLMTSRAARRQSKGSGTRSSEPSPASACAGLTSAEELLSSDVWLVRAPQHMDLNRLHDHVLSSLGGLPYEASAAKKSEVLTVVVPDKDKKATLVSLCVKGSISLHEKVLPDKGEFKFSQVRAPRFTAPPSRRDWRKAQRSSSSTKAKDSTTDSPALPRKRKRAI